MLIFLSGQAGSRNLAASNASDMMHRIGAAIRSWEDGNLTDKEARARIAAVLRTRGKV